MLNLSGLLRRILASGIILLKVRLTRTLPNPNPTVDTNSIRTLRDEDYNRNPYIYRIIGRSSETERRRNSK